MTDQQIIFMFILLCMILGESSRHEITRICGWFGVVIFGIIAWVTVL